MGGRGSRVKNMDDGAAQRGQGIGNDASMTAPPQDLGAHDDSPESLRQHDELTQRSREFFTHGIVGVAPKCGVTPGGVSAVGDWPTATPKTRQPNVGDAGGS